MPHVIVKLWPGKSELPKTRLAEVITKDVMHILNYGEESVSVAMVEIKPKDWVEKVYRPQIKSNLNQLIRNPDMTRMTCESPRTATASERAGMKWSVGAIHCVWPLRLDLQVIGAPRT